MHTEFFTRHQNSAFWLLLRGLIIQTQRSRPQLICSFSSRPGTCVCRGPRGPEAFEEDGECLGQPGMGPSCLDSQRVTTRSCPEPAKPGLYSAPARPCFLLPTRDIWFPAPLLRGCKTSSSWDISCFPPSSLLKIATGVNTGRHMGLQPPLTAH